MSSLGLLFVLWVFFAGSVLVGAITGKIVAFGAKGGGAGMGHICDRTTNPSNYWMMMLLYGAITAYFFLATDGSGSRPDWPKVWALAKRYRIDRKRRCKKLWSRSTGVSGYSRRGRSRRDSGDRSGHGLR